MTYKGTDIRKGATVRLPPPARHDRNGGHAIEDLDARKEVLACKASQGGSLHINEKTSERYWRNMAQDDT